MEARSSTNWINDFLAGAIGGSAGVVAGHPFDTTKVQLQTQEAGARYKGIWDAVSSVRHHGIIRGFYRGLSYPLITSGVTNAIIFGVYGSCLRLLAPDRHPTLGDIYWAGCAGGAVQLIVACPVDLVKCILQAQIPHKGLELSHPGSCDYYHGPTECLREIWRKKGVAGLYRGFWAMAGRDVFSYGLYLVCYEVFYAYLKTQAGTDSHGVVASVVGGGLAGCVSWMSTMPFDVVKSRLQADVRGRYRGTVDCLMQAVRREGFFVLYRGSLVTCLRAFPTNAMTFLFYTQTLKYLNRRTEDGGMCLPGDSALRDAYHMNRQL